MDDGYRSSWRTIHMKQPSEPAGNRDVNTQWLGQRNHRDARIEPIGNYDVGAAKYNVASSYML